MKTKKIFTVLLLTLLCALMVSGETEIKKEGIELNLEAMENLALEAVSSSGPVVVRKNVHSFIHPKYGYERGQEWAYRYYHIRTPDRVKNEEMYRYDLTGYSYGIARPLSFTWVGYLYAGYDGIYHGYARDNGGNNIPVSQYIGSDGHLYLKFGPISQYCNSFVLDYQSGSTGERIDHSLGGYDVEVLISGAVEYK